MGVVGTREPASANCPGREWVENVRGPKVVTPGMVMEERTLYRLVISTG